MRRAKLIVGGLEDISFPDWKIDTMRARVDTGARTSSIHVDDLTLLPRGRVRFYVVMGWRKHRRRHRVIARIKKRAYVRPSTGRRIARYVVETTLVLGPIRRKVELTLADRQYMRFRMLLGRTALNHDVLVDPARRCAAHAAQTVRL